MLSDLLVGRRKFVIARILACETLEDCLAWCTDSDSSAFEDIALQVNAQTLAAISKDDSKESFDAFLRRLPESVLAALGPGQPQVTEQIIDRLEARFAEYISSPHDPIRSTFDDCLSIAKNLYSTVDAASAAATAIPFASLQTSGVPHALDTQVLVGGKTLRHAQYVEIRLLWTGASFWSPEVWATPYVLFHELIAHALAHEDAVEFSGQFADGWMDVVAAQVHDASVAANTLDVCPRLPVRHEARVLEYGREMHRARYGPYSQKRLGRAAAESLARLCSEVAEAKSGNRFWQLSFALNRSASSKGEREELTDVIAQRLAADPSDINVAGALRDYAAAADEGNALLAAEAFATSTLRLQ